MTREMAKLQTVEGTKRVIGRGEQKRRDRRENRMEYVDE